MKKVMIALLGLVLLSTVSLGCRASGEVDPHGTSSVPAQH